MTDGEGQAPSDPAAPLTAEMKAMVAYLRLCYVATSSRDGVPNLSPKGSLKVLDDGRLVFGHIDSPNTVRNLQENPRVEVNVVDPFLRRGFRFKGRGEVSDDQALIEFAGADLGADYPVKAAVVIHVEEALAVHSPVYFHTDLTEDEVRESWQQKYGFVATSGDRR